MTAPAAVTPAAPAVLDPALSAVEAELAAWHVPGLELAVVRDAETVFVGGLGVRGVEDPEPVTATTLFHHGSCGKAFTGLLAALLADEGLLDLDAPVRRLVPELRLVDEHVAARVTTRDLLCHRSGLGRHDVAWITNPSWTSKDVLGRLEHLPLVADLRGQWSYSNFGYALAGVVIERVTGASFGEQLAARVFTPLGMTRSLSSVAPMQTDSDHATPHVVRDGAAKPTLFRALSGVTPAGELISCAADSVRWLQAQLGFGEALPPSAVAAAQQPWVVVPDGAAPFPEMEFFGYGLGWLRGSYRDRRLVWHNGGVDGFTTQTFLLPREGVGILASANQHLSNFPLAAVLSIADALLGERAEESWFDRLRPPDASPSAPEPRTVSTGPSHALASYAGSFSNALYGELQVDAGPTGLTARLGEVAVDLTHRHYDTWDLRYEPLEMDAAVTFAADPAGDIAGADVAFELTGDTVRFDRNDSGDAL